MKRLLLIPLFAIFAILSFSSCEESGEGTDEPSFVLIHHDPDNPIRIDEGQNIELEIGDYVLPAYSEGDEGWSALLYDGKCIVEDPSVALFYMGSLYAIQGGETSVTAGYKDQEIHFSVTVPKEHSYGTIYFTCVDMARDMPTDDDEGRIPFSDLLLVNGVITDKTCNFLSCDSEGNLWQGVTRDGRISLTLNGRELGDNASIAFPVPDLHYVTDEKFLQTRHNKLFYFWNNRYTVISADGVETEGTVQGGIIDMDIDAQGNIYLWTMYFGPNVWIISPDGTSTSHKIGAERILSGSLDNNGNDYTLCSYGDNKVGILKNGEALYSFTDVYNPKMVVSESDVWLACYSPEEAPNEAIEVTSWGLYLVKNDEIHQLATHLSGPGNMDVCITKSGVPFILAGDSSGYFVYKETAPVLFIPFINGDKPQFAVID